MRLLLLVLFALPVLAADTPVATDNFNRGPVRLTTENVNWEEASNGNGNGFAARGTNVDYDTGYSLGVISWKGSGSWTDDQYAKITLSNFTAGYDSWLGVAVRVTAASNTGYWAIVGKDVKELRVGAYNNGTRGEFADAWPVSAVAFAEGDTLRLEVIGTALKVFRNSTEVYSRTVSDFSTGVPGLAGYGVQRVVGDNWEGGTISAGGGSRRRVAVIE